MATPFILVNALGASPITVGANPAVAVDAVDTVNFNEAAANPTEFITALQAGAVLADPALASEQSIMETLKTLARQIQVARTSAGS